MLTLDLYNLYVLIVILGLVKMSLSQSGVSRLVSVSLGCMLSFSIFDSSLSFLPILFYLFRNQVEDLFLFIKTFFSRLKGFVTGQTQKNVLFEGQVSAMDRGDQGDSSGPIQPKTGIFGVRFPPSSDSTREEEGDNEKGPKSVTVVLPLPTQDQWDRILDMGDSILGYLQNLSLVYVTLSVCVPGSMNLFAQCRHSVQQQRYATRSVIGLVVVVYSFLQYSQGGGKALHQCLQRRLKALYDNAQPIQDLEELEAARKRFEAVSNRQVIGTNIVFDGFVEISHEQFSEFAFGILEDFSKAIEENRLEVCLNDLCNLPREKKEQFLREIESVSSSDIAILQECCFPVYKALLLISSILVDPVGLENELLSFGKKRSESSFEKKSLQPTEHLETPAFSKTGQLGLLKIGDRTLEKLAEERIANRETFPISPGYSYDQSQISLSNIQKDQIQTQTADILESSKWMERMAFDHSYLKKLMTVPEDQSAGTSSAFQPQSRPDLREVESNLKNTRLDDNRVFSKQDSSFVGEKGKVSENQLDISPRSSSPRLPPECFTPLEGKVEKAQYCVEERQYWSNLGGCTACLVFISQIAFAILRRLNYTQEWVKKATERGAPKWLFSLITCSNPKPHPEKEIFNLMVFILAINFLTLYFVFNTF